MEQQDIKQIVRAYLLIEKEIKTINASIKPLRQKKQEYYRAITDWMKQNNVRKINVKDYVIQRVSAKSTRGPTKKTLLDTLQYLPPTEKDRIMGSLFRQVERERVVFRKAKEQATQVQPVSGDDVEI